MTVSKARQQAVSKYMKANYDELKYESKGRARIQEHAKAQGESATRIHLPFIKETIRARQSKIK